MVRIRHLAIRSRDVARAVRFYSEGLGLRLIGPRRPGASSFDLTDGELNVTVLPFVGHPRDAAEEGDEAIHFGIVVPDSREAFLRLRALDGRSVRFDVKARNPTEADREPEGSFKVLDPDGNVIDVSAAEDEWRW